ncbi:TlpA family protein disulfide reductase [Prevotella veroralis]|uniref:Antioxidant, AhpC/TSA family n=1 Tax=Prevotella veroralis F0319 TaxID=649761 RepID=C9MMM2_9BACT|nr:TlpA disulfide reductase family protein [Prevotella veroralis]EEX19233.1 antioxidant, AhpC/TSA family [Prevotella veroralis F0319]QUB41041.1 TlpA family protein disulfide reductase [Prevotella veroralis]
MKDMKKIILMTMLAATTLAASAQDTKPYESKMSQIETEFHKLEAELTPLRQKDPSTFTEADKAKVTEIMAKADSLDSAQLATVLEIAEKFKTTTFPAKYIAEVADGLEYADLKRLCDPSTGYYNAPEMKKAKDLYEMYKLREPGSMYKELVMTDLNGKQMKLSDWAGKGKYVFVDFWASWCAPCRKEMPNVVEAYKRYKDKGLEIIGVSFDDNKLKWSSAVEKLCMTWPQMSDLKGWQSAAGKVYGIRSIPSNILLDKDGKIIAMDLRGEALQTELAKLLK